MVDKKELDSILINRRNEYGSFISNLVNIYKIKPSIQVTIVDKNFTYSGDFNESTCDFIENMLALKAARSLKASGDTYKDCINDFINYFTLAIDEVPGIDIKLYENVFDVNLVRALNLRKTDKNLDLSQFSITKILDLHYAEMLLK